MIFLTNLVFLLIWISNVTSYKLLLVFPVGARSHYFLGNELGKGLANLGHEVTIISAFEDKHPPKNYKEIVMDQPKSNDDSGKNNKNNNFQMESSSPYSMLFLLNSVSSMMTEMTFNHTKVQALLNSNEHFDAVIIEQFWNDGMKVFGHHFNAPIIAFSTMGPTRWVNNLVANPENPSYIPDILLSFSSDMTFYERAYNLVYGLVCDLVIYWSLYPSQNEIIKKYFPNAPTINELQNNISLVLTNSHESINAAVPHVPNMIDIGGFHVTAPKELPEELRNFMDNAKEGVIYFSLGTNLVPSDMPEEIKNIILKVLGSRKEKVLWKWDQDELENKPSNMMISKWFPQQSILAHPNCKLFITHGGLLSLTETVHVGVPVLTFPIFGDQKLNAARVRSKGFGLTLPFSEITEKALVEALDELSQNPEYRKNAKRCSKIMHDRPMKPIELADYWIKYVIRHKGAPHLRVAGTTLPLYKYYMLDIFGVIFGVILFTSYLLLKILGLCCRRKSVISKQDKSKQRKSKKE